MLPASSPLKCISPSDVYLLLKSSDFIQHDIDPEHVFEGIEHEAEGALPENQYELELVLRKWYPVDRSREVRCFVRRETLIGLSQRDPNYYEFWNEPAIQTKVIDAIARFWEEKIKGKWETTDGNCSYLLHSSRLRNSFSQFIFHTSFTQTPLTSSSHET